MITDYIGGGKTADVHSGVQEGSQHQCNLLHGDQGGLAADLPVERYSACCEARRSLSEGASQSC